MRILYDENLPELENPLIVYDYLIKVANKFKTLFDQIQNGKLLDYYTEPINNYYLVLCKKLSEGCETGSFWLVHKNLKSANFEDLFVNSNMQIIIKHFPHLFNIINQKNSGSNKFFALYNYIQNTNSDEQIEKLTKIDKVYTGLTVYNPDISKEEFYSKLFENENLDISGYFNDKLREISTYKNLPIDNLNLFATQIEQDENKNFFNKELIESKYKTYLKNFNVLQSDTTYLKPYYEIFRNIEYKYPRFIENLTNEKLTASDLSTNLNKFISYVNVFNKTNEQINENVLKELFFKLYLSVMTPDDQNTINTYVLKNNLLNKRLIQEEINIDITYVKLVKILGSAELNYFNAFKNLEYDEIKTNNTFTYQTIPKKFLNECVAEKILNKDKLSGFKFLIHIVDCEFKKSEPKNKLIYFFLRLNTTEINSARLISWKKLNTILNKLKDGRCVEKEINTLIKVIKLKKIIDPFLLTELKLLKQNLTDREIQKRVYYLLSALSPEKIDWNIMSLLFKYLYEKGMHHIVKKLVGPLGGGVVGGLASLVYGLPVIGTAVGSIVGSYTRPYTSSTVDRVTGKKEQISISDFKNYVFENIKVENFIKDEPTNPNPTPTPYPQYKFICFKIYSYFNFDSVIVSMNTIQKIVKQFDTNTYNEKIFDILKKIIARNSANLKQINKSSSAKLDYFVDKKWDKLNLDQYYRSQLYDILKEVADENLFPINVLDFLKENGIDVIFDNEIKVDEEDRKSLGELYKLVSPSDSEKGIKARVEKQYEPIYKMFQVFVDNDISEQREPILRTLDNMKYGVCEDYPGDCSVNVIITLINQSAPFISSDEQIKIFFATGKHSNPDYASEQELFSILDNLSKSSALVKNLTTQVTQVATDSITSAINSKLQSTALDMGFTEVPVDAIAKAKEIAQTAKTIAITAGVGFATAGAYYAVDKLFGNESSSENTSLAVYKANDFKSKLKLFVGSVGAGLTLYSAKNLFPAISSLVQDYIGYKSTASDLPIPSISMVVIGSIIMSGITKYLSEGQTGRDGTNSSDSTKSLIEKILDWIFDSIDKLYGFDGKKPELSKSYESESTQTTNQSYPNKNIESIYTYLTSQKLGSDDIFDSAILNEHPDQNAILTNLRSKYQEFTKLSIDSNPYVQLTKRDKKKIKKIIGKIVALELNLFKGNQPYTFVNAISKFLNE